MQFNNNNNNNNNKYLEHYTEVSILLHSNPKKSKENTYMYMRIFHSTKECCHEFYLTEKLLAF